MILKPAKILTFLILFFFWIVLSGKFDFFHLSMGVLSCLIVTYVSADLLFSDPKPGQLYLFWIRFVLYIPWLLYQVFLASIRLLYLSFHPKMMDLIDPKIIEFKSRLRSDMALVTFANSITLTPGTITVYVSLRGDFQVHAIDKLSAQSLPGDMEERIGRLFGET